MDLNSINGKLARLESGMLQSKAPASNNPFAAWPSLARWAILVNLAGGIDSAAQAARDKKHPLNPYLSPWQVPHIMPVDVAAWGHRYDVYEGYQELFIVAWVEHFLEQGYKWLESREAFEMACNHWKESEQLFIEQYRSDKNDSM